MLKKRRAWLWTIVTFVVIGVWVIGGYVVYFIVADPGGAPPRGDMSVPVAGELAPPWAAEQRQLITQKEWGTPPLRDSSAPYAGNPDETTAYAIQRGRYLTRAGDCLTCHTRPGGEPFAGGVPFITKFGTIYSSNITPDNETGIGNYTAEDLWHVMHEGIGKDGSPLYPGMPYAAYTHVSRRDVNYIYAYLMAREPVHNEVPANDLIWPLSWRWTVHGWAWLFFEEGVYEPDPSRSAAWNRGAYLVKGLGHCSGCHTPRNWFMAKEDDESLTGANFETWFAPNIRGAGLENWSVDELVTFFKTGFAAPGAAVGKMGGVVHHSLRYLAEQDLRAMAIYLKSLPALYEHDADEGNAGLEDDVGVAKLATVAASKREAISTGHMLYLTSCNACHRPDGEGVPNTFPTLVDNSVVVADDPTTAIHVVLEGGQIPWSKERPSQFAMPGFGWQLTDEQIADLLTFIRSSWGNNASPVDAQRVAEVRSRVGGQRPLPSTAPRRAVPDAQTVRLDEQAAEK